MLVVFCCESLLLLNTDYIALTSQESLFLALRGWGFVRIPLPHTQGYLMRFDWALDKSPRVPGGWDSHMKVTGMLVGNF